jgi:hypothetical protein
MGTHVFEDLIKHVGHKLECVYYGTPPVNAAVECLTCHEVLLDFDLDVKRIAWLDSANMPSHIHKTYDGGVTTVCGHKPRSEKNWTITDDIPRKRGGFSNYCRVCFKNGGKFIPFIKD